MELLYKNKKHIADINKKIFQYKAKFNAIDNPNLFINEDNFIAMCALLNKFENKIDLIYIDPPFNTGNDFKFGENRISTISFSNSDLSAYSDNMPFDEYLEFLRERLILIHKLLSPNGTLYFHIDLKVGHYVKILLDEIFGINNFINDITRVKSNPKNFNRKAFGNQKDLILIYAKNKGQNIFNDITTIFSDDELNKKFPKIDEFGRRYTTVPCHAPGETKNGNTNKEWNGIKPPAGRHWRCSVEELEYLNKNGLIEWSKNNIPRIKKYADEHNGKKIQDIWLDYKDPQYPQYPTQKNYNMLEMIVKQSSNENSIIMDCFCGSGNFLLAGVKNNRKIIGIDKSQTAINIACKNLKDVVNFKILYLNNMDTQLNQIDFPYLHQHKKVLNSLFDI